MKQQHKVGDIEFYRGLADYPLGLYDRERAAGYRTGDEDTQWTRNVCQLLGNVSSWFDHPISVLDLGCGTGRYFHCLKNLERLTGVDVSHEMLTMARHPVRQPKITASIDLVCVNMFEVTFPPQSFDLIYCIGVMGQYCPLDSFILNKVCNMLKSTGTFVFTVIDKLSPTGSSWKRIIAQATLPLLPPKLKRKVDVRLRRFRVTEQELKSTMDTTQFSDYKISRFHSASGEGKRFLVCVASLTGIPPLLPMLSLAPWV